MARSLLLISRQAPWAGLGAREALDIVLAGGAFDLPIGLLFLDDGVLQLASGQNAKAVQQKDLSANRSEEHTSELQSLMRISYAVFCLKKKKNNKQINKPTL